MIKVRVPASELRRIIREEMTRSLVRERTEGVVEHDTRFDEMMVLLVDLMNEYQMDPKAISQLASRRIYEKFPKPPWVNDADVHTLSDTGGDEKKATDKAKGSPAKKPENKPSAEEGPTPVEDLVDEGGLEEKAPHGWEKTVKAMKHHPEIDNPWALANSMKDKGFKHHK